MGRSVGLVFLLLLGASWASDARELGTIDLFIRETEISDVSVLQINPHESKGGIQASEVGKNNVCTLCEEFTAEALNYLSENETQTEIMNILHKTCSKLLPFKQECITLVDYYVPLFFLEISSIQPGDLCEKVNICEQMVFLSRRFSKNNCELCHRAVEEALLKLKDPDTQLEILELLLKACDSVESYIKQCKKMVFEYGPLILANAEEFLETTDICIMFHACDVSAPTLKQELPIRKTSMLFKE